MALSYLACLLLTLPYLYWDSILPLCWQAYRWLASRQLLRRQSTTTSVQSSSSSSDYGDDDGQRFTRRISRKSVSGDSTTMGNRRKSKKRSGIVRNTSLLVATKSSIGATETRRSLSSSLTMSCLEETPAQRRAREEDDGFHTIVDDDDKLGETGWESMLKRMADLGRSLSGSTSKLDTSTGGGRRTLSTSVETASDYIQEIKTKQEWNTLMETSMTKVVVLKWTASWCQTAKAIQPVFASLAETYVTNTVFACIDADESSDLALEQDIRSCPTFAVYQHGHVLKQYSGCDTEELWSLVETAMKASGSTWHRNISGVNLDSSLDSISDVLSDVAGLWTRRGTCPRSRTQQQQSQQREKQSLGRLGPRKSGSGDF